MTQIRIVPVIKQLRKCPTCKYEWYSSSPERRICCAKCRSVVTVFSPQQKPKIPNGIPFAEEMKVIKELPTEQKIRYYLALAMEAKTNAEREVCITAAQDIIDEENERLRNNA